MFVWIWGQKNQPYPDKGVKMTHITTYLLTISKLHKLDASNPWYFLTLYAFKGTNIFQLGCNCKIFYEVLISKISSNHVTYKCDSNCVKNWLTNQGAQFSSRSLLHFSLLFHEYGIREKCYLTNKSSCDKSIKIDLYDLHIYEVAPAH